MPLTKVGAHCLEIIVCAFVPFWYHWHSKLDLFKRFFFLFSTCAIKRQYGQISLYSFQIREEFPKDISKVKLIPNHLLLATESGTMISCGAVLTNLRKNIQLGFKHKCCDIHSGLLKMVWRSQFGNREYKVRVDKREVTKNSRGL